MLISVIIPVYNNENEIRRSIKSIQEQTYKDLEIIIINDGSSDNSREIIEELMLTDSRIKLINTPNQGQSQARNLGVSKASGDWILFLDADDYYQPYSIEYMVRLQKAFAADLVMTKTGFANSDIPLPRSITNIDIDKEKAITPEVALEHAYYGRFSGISPCGKLYRKSILKTYPFPANKIHEDMDTLYLIIHNSNRIITGSILTFQQIIRASSTSVSPFHRGKLNYFSAVERNIDFIKNHYPHNTALYKAAISMYGIGGLRTFFQMIQAKEYTLLKPHIKRARLLYPKVILNRQIPLRSKIGYSLLCLSPRLYAFLKRNLDNVEY